MSIALQFSGGKDSLAVLYLNRSRLHEMTVYFGDTGNVYPHMAAFVRRKCGEFGATLKVIKPPIPIEAFHANYGLPSDIIPVEASFQMRPWNKGSGPMLQSNLTCCSAMLWKPMQDALIADGIKTVIRGSKACDGHVGVPDGYVDANGITYESPLWDWTDGDVFQYLREVDAELPEHYQASNNSADCIFCTAFLTSDGAKERIEWTKKRYPELWPVLNFRLNLVRSIIDSEREKIDGALSVGE